MSSSAYKCGATAGQTAAGFMASPDFWALIGLLAAGRANRSTGSGPVAQWSSAEDSSLLSIPYSLLPQTVTIRYSLAADGPVSLTAAT